jgi:hypothetical protein
MEEVLPDWSGFKKTETMNQLNAAVTKYVEDSLKTVMAGRVQETKTSVLRNHRNDLEELQPLARLEVSEIIDNVTLSNPMVSPETLSTLVDAIKDPIW